MAQPMLSLATLAEGQVQYRVAGLAAKTTHVLLHGIGSGSASWSAQLAAAEQAQHLRLLAWEAPGYGMSSALPQTTPEAHDYALRMWQWLDHLQVETPICLVGHSLGALMAARAARLQPQRIRRLVLLAPARGYGDASTEERTRVLQTRLQSLQTLGPQGMANARAAAMLSPQAKPEWVAAVRDTMSQIRPPGYTQAVHMLCSGRLLHDVRQLSLDITVASGESDGITSPQACDDVALAAGQSRISLGPVGHACALEASAAVNELLHFAVIATEQAHG
jgi:pimeloyl-ACP methyl ester carboxylesterase